MHSLARSEASATGMDDELAARVARVADRADVRGPRRSERPDTARRDDGGDDTGALRFRGATYDMAVQAAEDALGARPQVIAAHRIRRGGIGGFFATDLGVEVQVEVPGETVDQAVERLVESGGGDDREAWIRELARAAGIEPPVTDEHLHDDHLHDEHLHDVVFERPTMRLVEPDTAGEPTPTEVFESVPDPAPEPVTIAAASTAHHPVEIAGRVSATPNRRQVDLAVVAASEMIRLTGDQAPGTTVTIQVTVATADGRSVSAEARIEPPAKPARRSTSRAATS